MQPTHSTNIMTVQPTKGPTLLKKYLKKEEEEKKLPRKKLP